MNLQNYRLKSLNIFLGKWVHNFKEQNHLINVVDCMFVALEKTDQKDVAMKWWHESNRPERNKMP